MPALSLPPNPIRDAQKTLLQGHVYFISCRGALVILRLGVGQCRGEEGAALGGRRLASGGPQAQVSTPRPDTECMQVGPRPRGLKMPTCMHAACFDSCSHSIIIEFWSCLAGLEYNRGEWDGLNDGMARLGSGPVPGLAPAQRACQRG